MKNMPGLFGKTRSGQAAHICRLTGFNGMEAEVTDFGAALVALRCPDRDGKLRDLVLGYDSVSGYEEGKCYFGATVGRNANRIGGAAFTLNGVTYRLNANEGENNLHSGPDSYAYRMWEIQEDRRTDSSVTFRLSSPDGDQGFPGNLEVAVTYEMTRSGGLKVRYHAASDRDTLVNLTNHGYFNLNGHGGGEVLDHIVKLNAEWFTPLDETFVPTGEIRSVSGTPFDFRKFRKIRDEIEADDPQLRLAGGYDHNYVICGVRGTLRRAASVFSDCSGIGMEVWTDRPCIQFYTGNFVGEQTGKAGVRYGDRCGFCLETQCFPNCVNTPEFPSGILKAGKVWETTTMYRFFTKPESL